MKPDLLRGNEAGWSGDAPQVEAKALAALQAKTAEWNDLEKRIVILKEHGERLRRLALEQASQAKTRL